MEHRGTYGAGGLSIGSKVVFIRGKEVSLGCLWGLYRAYVDAAGQSAVDEGLQLQLL